MFLVTLVSTVSSITLIAGRKVLNFYLNVYFFLDVQDINVTWKRSIGKDSGINSCLVEGRRYTTDFSEDGIASLTISDCQSSDAGMYSCTVNATNPASLSVTTSAYLTVTGE